MAMPQTITKTRHPYASGGFKPMLINGEWVKSASGKTFERRNPATGDLLATVAEGDAEDINVRSLQPGAPSKARGAK
jgi:aldehyde dehydrogenase (NAD+)